MPKRFEAYGWHTLTVEDVNDLESLSGAIQAGIDEDERPTLISVKTIIGCPAPNQQHNYMAHGSPLDEVRATKEILGWDPDKHFFVPDGVYEHFNQVERGERAQAEWRERYDSRRSSNAELAKEWDHGWADPPRPLDGLAKAIDDIDWGKDKLATRSAGQKAMEAFAPLTPTMIGGAADLAESTKTEFPGELFTPRTPDGRNIKFGVREHGMGGAVNGMGAHGGLLRPYGSTFLQFSDYMRGAVRLSALTALDVAWVYTHDSVGLGQDGPTHQPVEHYAALRAIPGLVFMRPGDAWETAYAWAAVLENDVNGPVAFALSRQDLPIYEAARERGREGVRRGAYVLIDADDPQVVLVGTGSELQLCVQAAEQLDGARVVSMPSWEWFAEQDEGYRGSVLPDGVPKVSVEAGVAEGWAKWVDASISLERFGASAPGAEALEKLGFTVDNVVARAREVVEGKGVPGATPHDTEPPRSPQG